MRIHDISLTIAAGMTVWPGDPPVQRTLIYQMDGQQGANVSQLCLSAHTGTHVDAPVHFVSGGSGIDATPLDILVGPCSVRAVQPGGLEISDRDLAALSLPSGTTRLLLKTANSLHWQRGEPGFLGPYIALAESAAQWLIANGIRLIGIDYLSVERFGDRGPIVHRLLLAAGIVPLEGVDLSAVAPSEYTLVCLPLKIAGSDGSPARVILIE